MLDEPTFRTEIECGFNLPMANKTSGSQLNQLVAIATLFSSVAIAAVLGVQIWLT